ncbi:MAG: hypothetical protein ABL958_05160 [Bdellovibrionia bacterium]
MQTAIQGPEAARDAMTISLLDDLLGHGFQQSSVDVRGKYAECAPNQACEPIPMKERYRTGFIWQTHPWDLYIEGDDRIESPGVDYLLTYWMSRYHHLQ